MRPRTPITPIRHPAARRPIFLSPVRWGLETSSLLPPGTSANSAQSLKSLCFTCTPPLRILSEGRPSSEGYPVPSTQLSIVSSQLFTLSTPLIHPVFKFLRTLSHFIEKSPLCFQILTKV